MVLLLERGKGIAKALSSLGASLSLSLSLSISLSLSLSLTEDLLLPKLTHLEGPPSDFPWNLAIFLWYNGLTLVWVGPRGRREGSR